MENKSCYEYLDKFKKEAKQNEKLGLLQTSFPTLNEVLGGGFKYGLVIIGAIASLGKTSLLIKEAINWARNGYAVLYFSYEMLQDELMAKMLSYNSYEICIDENSCYYNDNFKKKTYSYLDFLYNKVDSSLYDEIAKNFEYSKNIFIFERDTDICKIERLEKFIKDYKKEYKKVVVVIDYLQIIVNDIQKDSLKNAIDKYISELRYFANKEKVPIFAISSISRNYMYSKINMDSFKETGGIEYGTDYLIALEPKDFTTDANTNKEKLKRLLIKDERDLNLVILKNRSGLSGMPIPIQFIPKFNEFKEK